MKRVGPGSNAASLERELETVEVDLLLEGIYRTIGFDFRCYTYSSLKQKLWNHIEAEGIETISELQNLVLHDDAAMARLVTGLSVTVSTMFRDAGFYAAFRSRVIPVLRRYPSIRIWHAGCAAGEEVYSMAILLTEEGLYERALLYATDINETALTRARSGIYPLAHISEYASNYQKAGGTRSFSEYYRARFNHAVFSPGLRRNIVFARHDLVTDQPFSDVNVILCRNVLPYFDNDLQQRVHELLYRSLQVHGVLALGSRECIPLPNYTTHYELVDERERIYGKLSQAETNGSPPSSLSTPRFL